MDRPGCLGLAGEDAFAERVADTLRTVGLDHDILMLGLRGTMHPLDHPGVAERVLEARHLLRGKLALRAYRGIVEPFDRGAYNRNMTVAENILFGTPVGPVFGFDHIAENDYVLGVLEQVGIKDHFLKNGVEAARIMVELFQGLQGGNEFFERFSFVSADDLPEVEAAVRRVGADGLEAASEADRSLFMALPFKLVTERHRLGLIDAELETKLLEARRIFAENLPRHYRDAVAFFAVDEYNPPASVLDNILFGKLVYGRPRARERIAALIGEVVNARGLPPDADRSWP